VARYDDILEIEPSLAGRGLRIGIVMSRYNIEASEGLLGACSDELRRHGVNPSDMLLVTVPGALEVPLAVRKLAQSGRCDAVIALGAVIRGETYHFDIVANESAAGLTRVQQDTGIPIANGILTTDDDDQALARMSAKGAEAARVTIEMANLLKTLDEWR